MPVQGRECECSACLQPKEQPDWANHHRMNVFLSRLDEQQRRWYVALESQKIGRGGEPLMSQITGMDVETIRHRPLSLRYADLSGAKYDRYTHWPVACSWMPSWSL